MYHPSSYTNSFYGGGLQSAWNQSIGQTVNFSTGQFYKVKFHRSGEAGTLMSIHLVNPDNWDDETSTLHQWTSTSPAADPILMPFWSAVSTPNIFITGFKIF